MPSSRNASRNGTDKMQDHVVSRLLLKHVRRIISFVGNAGPLRLRREQICTGPRHCIDDTARSNRPVLRIPTVGGMILQVPLGTILLHY